MDYLIDTHCHLASARYTDPEELRRESIAANVRHCVTQGTHPEDWERTLQLAGEMPEFISPCLAVHPSDCTRVGDEDLEKLTRLCRTHALAAIGETGLDYYWPAPEGWEEAAYHARQHTLLEQHFQLAQDLGLNISLHTRDRVGSACFEDAFAIARQFPRVRPVFHCFIGTRAQAERIFSQLNGLVSFTGIITFKKTEATQDVAAWCPEDRIMVETDSPFLSPEPHRGQLNTPARVRLVAEKLAQLRGCSLEQLAHATTQNAQNFFAGLKHEA